MRRSLHFKPYNLHRSTYLTLTLRTRLPLLHFLKSASLNGPRTDLSGSNVNMVLVRCVVFRLENTMAKQIFFFNHNSSTLRNVTVSSSFLYFLPRSLPRATRDFAQSESSTAFMFQNLGVYVWRSVLRERKNQCKHEDDGDDQVSRAHAVLLHPVSLSSYPAIEQIVIPLTPRLYSTRVVFFIFSRWFVLQGSAPPGTTGKGQWWLASPPPCPD